MIPNTGEGYIFLGSACFLLLSAAINQNTTMQMLRENEEKGVIPHLFLSGRLMGSYGIIWNDELDIEAETIYEDGRTVRVEEIPANLMIANAVLSARAKAGISQSELSAATGIDQSDISKIERGVANPSVNCILRRPTATDAALTAIRRSQRQCAYFAAPNGRWCGASGR